MMRQREGLEPVTKLGAALMLTGGLVLAACTSTVTGTAEPVGGEQVEIGASRSAAESPRTTAPRTSGPSTSDTATRTSTPTTPAPEASIPIADAGLADDCLLDGAQMGTLAGTAPMTPEQTSVQQSDGSSSESCFYIPENAFGPGARTQVLVPLPGATMTEVMDAVAGTPVPGVGDRSSLITTGNGDAVLWVVLGERVAAIRLFAEFSAPIERFTVAGQQAAAALATR